MRITTHLIALFVAAHGIVLAPQASAELYKSVDEKGTIDYPAKSERKDRRDQAALKQERRTMMATRRSRMQAERREALEAARKKHRQQLVQACDRNRMTECLHGDTLQRLEDQNRSMSTRRRVD
jgi:hypothetical protein